MSKSSNAPPVQLDAIVVGAGFAGIYQLYSLRRIGLSARVLEAGEGVGGTWFWNRYPGARCDVESLDYSYSFSDELQQEWDWKERYAPQPDILRYINHVVDRFDLRRDIQLNARVTSAIYDEAEDRWLVTTEGGDRFSARYCIMATGCLSIPQAPQFPGLESFKGRWYHSANWPHEGVDFAGQRVGLIGTGSSGVQMTPEIAQRAKHLTVFQRTANYSVPAQNEPITPEQLAEVKSTYGARRERALETHTGHFLIANDKSAMEVSEAERRKEFEFRWKGAGGGFRMLRAFNDLMVNKQSNDQAAEFVRSKIRATVKDPVTAELLCPRDDLPFGTKRLCVDTDYYQTFNRDNVSLVDVRTDPLVEATPNGLRTQSGQEYPLDVIVFATGFDAMTGALKSIDVRGVGGQALRDKWVDGPRTYLGLAVAGFPNLFILAGPGSPSVLSNMVHSIELHVNWLTRCLEDARARGVRRIEAQQRAEDDWVHHVNEVADRTLYPTANSWYMGSNMPGKPRVFMPYVAGVPAYRKIVNEVAADGYRGFEMV
ncbi:NAD(P)/FAD-dependent oxidoreductase [Hydrogenophaga sp. IBVHS1]|uniref:flavin-containing monooxygenase n=1 Tax=unclassified Hydrogenophaga TaxID=2610897 RepID=UPI000A2E40A3|nr:NAD(P)/FAD-dependent oxidoreductase [Hydrogenophaga sp. IBVHS1]OSZ74671.1 cyclohexanone monooxygenase [Hydrogenophaga sp. IBVHS1]